MNKSKFFSPDFLSSDCCVSVRYLMMLLNAWRCDSLEDAWKWAQKHTSNITGFLFSSLFRLQEVSIGFVIYLNFSMSNLFISSLKYLAWLMKFLSLSWWIWSFRKHRIFPITANSFWIILEKSLNKDLLVAPKMISLTTIWTNKMSWSVFLIKEFYELVLLETFFQARTCLDDCTIL